MDDDGGILLNVSTERFTDVKRQKTTKKQRLNKRRQERKAEEILIEELKTGNIKIDKSPHRAVAATDETGRSEKHSPSKEKGQKRKHHDTPGEEEGPPKMYKSTLFYNNPEIPSIGKTPVEEVKEDVFCGDKFSELGLHPFMVSNLEDKLHMKEATSVQKSAIPHMLAGKDILIKSQTGSGKTLAYAVPIVQILQGERPKISRSDGILAIVIVPTRELALQSFDTFQKLVYPFTWVVPGCLMGGERRKAEKARLRKGINIVVSTPGRLLDHIENTKNVHLDHVRWLVIDEADRLLDMGFEKEVRKIVNALSEKGHKDRRTVLLSATLNPGVERLAGMSLQSPIKVDLTVDHPPSSPKSSGSTPRDEVSEKIATPENLKHHCVIVPSKLRLVSLAAFLLWKCKMAAKRSKILVFMSTQDAVDFHHRLFQRCLLESEEEDEEEGMLYRLHGEMLQKERTEVFNKFGRADSGVLFCTDVAARGLDLPQVRWIVQYMPPGGSTDYIHRVGRTARIGSRGNALLFLTPSEANYTKLLADCSINLIEVQMNDILKTLLVEKDKLDFLWDETEPPHTIEEAASSIQAKFINYVRADMESRTLARKAYQSFVGAYTAYPSSVKHIFHVKNLHLGHVATSFGLTEAPTKIGNIVGNKAKKHDPSQHKVNPRRPGSLSSSMHKSNTSEFSSGFSSKMAVSTKYTRKEKRKLASKKKKVPTATLR